jgi:hypothetical protein
MSSMQPTRHPLLDRLLLDLSSRNVDLSEKAVDAIVAEFAGRMDRSNDPDALLDQWNRDWSRYLDAIEAEARRYRAAQGLPKQARVILGESQVRLTFALCPGPA